VFESEIVGGAIPKEFIKPIEDGIREALTHGVVAGYPVNDVRVELYDGSYHDVDSSEMAFKIAGAMAFQDAAKKAKPVLLEPVMRVEVVVPKDHMDDIMGNLVSRRGEVQSQQGHGGRQIISARVPLSEMFGYAADLPSRTHGLGTCSISFDRYQEVVGPPPDENVAVREPRDRGPQGRSSAATVPEPEPERRTRATARNTVPLPPESDVG
jgi:elongation factor G